MEALSEESLRLRSAAPAHRLAVWLAWGGGMGRVPWAPGTFGSVLGVAWFGVLLWDGRAVVFSVGALLGIALAVWACDRAEAVLGRHDPPSVVLDEIVAVPVCFLGLLAVQGARSGFPDLVEFLQAWPGWVVPAVFVGFRVMDIAKPWPIRPLQRLPGGWGIVADDVLAAGGVAVVGGIAALVGL